MEVYSKNKEHRKAGNVRYITGRDFCLLIFEDIVLTAGFAWIFYDSVFGLFLFPLTAFLNHKRFSNNKTKKWQDTFNLEYKELLISLTGALQIGYSVERAFEECETTILSLYGKESVLYPGLHELNQKVKMRTPVEKAFLEMSDKFKSEDMTSFAEVFRFAKRLGGNYVENIRQCALKISDKLELQNEIQMAVAEKQFELNVMIAMPVGILSYMKLTSPDFMSSIYHNTFGICMMTACIVIYLFSIFLGKKITDIRV